MLVAQQEGLRTLPPKLQFLPNDFDKNNKDHLN